MVKSLIKSDFMKLKKSRSLIICCIVAVCLGAVMALLYVNAWNTMGENIENARELMMQMGIDGETIDSAFSVLPEPYFWSYANIMLSDGSIPTFAAICAGVFIASEYSMGTIKNTISRGFSRTKIYVSKLMVSCVTIIILGIAYVVGTMAVCAIFVRGGSEISAVQMLLSVLSYIFLFAAMASVYLMIAVIMKKTGVAIAVSIVIPAVISSVITIITYSNNEFSQVAKYWLFNTPSFVEKMCIDGQAYIPLLISVFYFAVSTAVGLTVFKRQEIK